MKKIFLFISLLILAFLISCDASIEIIDSTTSTSSTQANNSNITTTSGSTVDTNFYREVDFDLEFDAGIGIASIYQSIEDGAYYIVTESRVGYTIANAYMVLSDGTKELIDDISDFLIANGVVKIEVNFVPGVALEGFSLDAESYNGYYLKYNYKMQIHVQPIPYNASNQVYRFYSSNPETIEVTNQGRVTVKGIGTAAVTVVSLEGNFKKTIQFNIQDGTTTLKDSLAELDYSEVDLVGNRYDDNSGQASEFISAASSQLSNSIIAVGKSKYDSDQNIALIKKFDRDTGSIVATLNIDSSNQYFSEELFEVEYDPASNLYFTVGYAIENDGDGKKGVLVKIQEGITEITDFITLEGIVLKNNDETIENNTVYTDVAVYNENIYVIGFMEYWEGGILGILEETLVIPFIHVYNSDLDFVESVIMENVVEFTSISLNPYSGALVISGTEENSTFIMEWDPETNNKFLGYYSSQTGARIIDVAAVSETLYVAVGNSQIEDKDISFVVTYVKQNEALREVNQQTNEMYEGNYVTRVFVHNGFISVIGYAIETTGSIFDRIHWEYSTITNFTYDLEVMDGTRFFNGNNSDGKGTKQRFNDAIITDFGELIGIGQSNYSDADITSAYIQFDLDSRNK